jgi:hypothetical protein
MEYYIYSVELPFSGIEIFYREINTKEQLILSKSNTFLPSGQEFDLDYAKLFQKIISNCVENKEDFYKLNIVDYILFVTKLRIMTLGANLDVNFENKSNPSDLKAKITLDLNVFMKLLYEIASEALNENEIESSKIKIKLGWPNIKSEYIFLTENKEESVEKILVTLPEYIKTIHISDDNIINLDNFNTKQKKEIYEKMPVSLRTNIQIKVLNSIKVLASKNLFNIPKMEYFKLNFYNKSYLDLIRLFFSGELKSIYNDYYILASKNINPEYVDTMSITDRKVFCSFVDEEIKAKSNNNNTNIPTNGDSTQLQDLIDEFEG